MFKIITEPNCIRINDALIPKSIKTITKLSNGVRIDNMDLDYTKTTIDGVQVLSVDQLFNFFRANGFNEGGGSTGEGVESVIGDLVDNTNPKNPIVNIPDYVNWTRDDRFGYYNLKDGTRIIVGSENSDACKIMTTQSGNVLNNIRIAFNQLDQKIKKFTFVFICDVNEITIEPLGLSKVTNVPNRAKNGDVWVVMYDKGDWSWDLISTNYTQQTYEVDLYEVMTNMDNMFTFNHTYVGSNLKVFYNLLSGSTLLHSNLIAKDDDTKSFTFKIYKDNFVEATKDDCVGAKMFLKVCR